MKEPRRIVLLGLHRTWTSVLGEQLSAGAGLPYIYEPLHFDARTRARFREEKFHTGLCRDIRECESARDWFRSALPSREWLVKDLFFNQPGYASPMTVDRADLVIVTSRDDARALASLNAALTTRTWNSPEEEADKGRKHHLLGRAKAMFETGWRRRRTFLERLERPGMPECLLLPPTLEEAREALGRAGFTLPAPVHTRRARDRDPLDLMRRPEELIEFVENLKRR